MFVTGLKDPQASSTHFDGLFMFSNKSDVSVVAVAEETGLVGGIASVIIISKS
jgi:hypothetical protein